MPWQKTHITGEGGRSRKNERYARRFAARLHSAFTDLVTTSEGIESLAARSRYALLLLYRLMFLYFLQQLGLLAGDRYYLQRRLHRAQAEQVDGYGFYRETLRPLFTTTPTHFPLPIATLFSPSAIERHCSALAIPDATFTRIFALFNEYNWRINDASDGGDGEIVPEMLSVLFEQGISQRETGSYYTPVDVATYIARNTVLPALFTRLQERCAAADALLWLHAPRSIFAVLRWGGELSLPSEIFGAVQDVTQRQVWQQRAPRSYALPGEVWRDVLARRAHLVTIATHWHRDDDPDRLKRVVTWNMDQQQLVLDTLRQCQQPMFLAAFYQTLRGLTVLDPTCGSGAFLFATLAQLEPLYSACLARMEELVGASNVNTSIDIHVKAIREYLAEAGQSEERQRTILMWIIQHNLYGVDILEEAVEICRLRLFLKVLACGRQEIQLPADFGRHIRVGNSLVGLLHASTDPGPQSANMAGTFHWDQVFPEVMRSGGFDVVLGNPPYLEYKRTRQSYTVAGYTTLETGNLYSLVIERSAHLLAPTGRFGMIVPTSATCTDGYRSLQKLLLAQQELHIASFSDQRGRLFAIPHPRLCIILYEKAAPGQTQPGKVFATPYIKVGYEERASLFERLHYTEVTHQIRPGLIPRYGSLLECAIHDKIALQAARLGEFVSATGAYAVYYTRKLSWFVQVTPFVPLIVDAGGQTRAPSELKRLCFSSPSRAQLAFVALNSNLFYWLITTGSDCRNLNRREVLGLHLDLASIEDTLQHDLCQLARELECNLQANSVMRPMHFKNGSDLKIQCMYPARSKALIDEIDRLLAYHYHFTAEELDFLLYYDYQYRQPN